MQNISLLFSLDLILWDDDGHANLHSVSAENPAIEVEKAIAPRFILYNCQHIGVKTHTALYRYYLQTWN